MEDLVNDKWDRNNPLLHDVVLRTLFKFVVGVADLQSCRLVCYKWEQISREHFVKKSTVFIQSRWSPDGEEVRGLETFRTIFPSPSWMPFKKFDIQGRFSAEEFDGLFKCWNSLRELTLGPLQLLSADGKGLSRHIVKNWRNLNSLSCTGSSIGIQTSIVIPCSQISSIKKLHLDGNYSLVFDERISPVELSIQGNVSFLLGDGEKLNSPVHLKEFVDFGKTEQLIMNQRQNVEVILDVTDCHRLEILSVHGPKLRGLSRHSTIKELSISSPLDISTLPIGVEKLILAREYFSCSSGVDLPQLKYLKTIDDFNLPNFVSCPNLTDLVIGKDYYFPYPVVIPKNVSRMFFPVSVRKIFQFPRSKITHLDYLHLMLNFTSEEYDWSAYRVLEILKSVQTKTLILTFIPSVLLGPLSEEFISEFRKIIKIQRDLGGTLAIGRFKWIDQCPFFLDLVDKKTEFYFFKNDKGVGLEEGQFKNMILLH